MDDRKILEKAILKAFKNGWLEHIENLSYSFVNPYTINLSWGEHEQDLLTWRDMLYEAEHGFAKALWGEEPYMDKLDGNDEYLGYKCFEHHLREMVIADDPLKYLAEHI